MALSIKAQRWVAVWFKCPKCGSQTAQTRLTPWRYRHLYIPHCHGWKCDSCDLEIVERRWYTTFCIEAGISQTTIAGTLAAIGPFKLCDIVHRDIRAFKKWYRQRRAELDEQARQYYERQRQIEAEAAERRERQRQQEALIKEAAQIAYKREHAAELIAEQVAASVWIEPVAVPDNDKEWFSDYDLADDLDDDHPF